MKKLSRINNKKKSKIIKIVSKLKRKDKQKIFQKDSNKKRNLASGTKKITGIKKNKTNSNIKDNKGKNKDVHNPENDFKNEMSLFNNNKLKNNKLYYKNNKNNLINDNLEIIIKFKSQFFNNSDKNEQIYDKILGKKRKLKDLSPESNLENEQTFSKSTNSSGEKENIEIKINLKESENVFEDAKIGKKKGGKFNILIKKHYYEEEGMKENKHNKIIEGNIDNKIKNYIEQPKKEKSPIKLFKDRNFISNKSKYIKYNPLNIINTNKSYYLRKNIIKDIKYPKLLPILLIPRIKPPSSHCQKLILSKLKGKVEICDNNLKIKEKQLYSGSITLKEKKEKNSVNVPCFKDSKIFLKRQLKNKMIYFNIDNDKDTDSETADSEKVRALYLFHKSIIKFKKEKDYIEKNISRKIQFNKKKIISTSSN